MKDQSFELEAKLKKAWCEGADLSYDIMIKTNQGVEVLDIWYKSFIKTN